MGDPILKLTDGDTDINLLTKEGDFGLFLEDWTPTVADYKNEGIWRDSSLADGRRLVDYRWENVVETYELIGSGYEQNDLAHTMQDARRLLEKAASYWASNWQDEPVWIEAKAKCETNTRYGLVYKGRIPEDDNPYAQPFFKGESAVLDDLALMVERLPWWLGFAPVNPCETQATETQTECFPNYLLFNGSSGNVNCGSNATLDDLPDFAVAGKGQVTLEAWIRADGYGGGGGFGRIIDKTNISFLVNAFSGLYCLIKGAAQMAISSSGLDEFTADGLQHHVLATYDETGAGTPAARVIYLAIDGVWVTSYVAQNPSIGNYMSDAASDLYIGNDAPTAGTAFDGGISWVRVSDSIRYDPAGGDFTPEPRCELPPIDANVMLQVIYEGSGATTYDRSGNGNNGAITDAVWDCDCTVTDIDNIDCDCVQTSGQQSWPYQEWLANTVQPVNQVYALIEASCGYMLAAEQNIVWRSATGAAVWTAAAVSPAMIPYSMVEASDGYIYCAGSGGVYRSADCGNNWVLRDATATTARINSLVEFNGDLYLARATTIERSTDGGATWNVVFTATGTYALLAGSDGYLYASVMHGTILPYIYRSSDGSSWDPVISLQDRVEVIAELSDGFLYAGDIDGRIYRSTNGLNWSLWTDLGSGIVPTITDILLGSDGFYYIVEDQGGIWVSADSISWDNVASPGGQSLSLVEYSGNNRIYVAQTGAIWWSPEVTTVGRSETCLDEVFFANKANLAQLTHVFVYDAGTATYISQFPASALPFLLLPSPFTAGDIVYFGIRESVFNSGTFCSLVFDITQALIVSGASLFEWEYSIAGPAWNPLTIQDGTGTPPFSNLGVNSVSWVPPTDWDAIAINGITAYWVRLRVDNPATWIQSPMQGNRDVYTVTWPRVDIDELQVEGDIPALLDIKAHNRSDDDGYTNKDERDLLDNRFLIGLRSLSRGSNFCAYINIAEDGIVADTYPQNPTGITVTDGTGSATGVKLNAPSAIACVHTTPPTGSLTTYADAATITFGSSIARDYYGTYHAFLRAHLEEPSSSPAGDDEDVRIRLKIQSGSGSISKITQHRRFVGWDENGETFKDWQLLDFGRVNLPVSSLFRSTELPDEFTITIQISSETATNLEVWLYDLILLPVDEWAGDFIDNALEVDSGVENGYMMDIDSMTYPKQRIRALVRTADSAAFTKSVYQPITPGPAILQANADQRLWFLTARAVYMGEATAGAGVATLTDSYADFLRAGVKSGMIAYDITGGTSATVVSVTKTTVVCDAAIWTAGDDYMIICNGIYRSEPWNLHSVQLRHNPRYLSFRGNR